MEKTKPVVPWHVSAGAKEEEEVISGCVLKQPGFVEGD
jgi:hypothetical protein